MVMEMNLWYEINVTAIRNSLPIIEYNLPKIFVSMSYLMSGLLACLPAMIRTQVLDIIPTKKKNFIDN